MPPRLRTLLGMAINDTGTGDLVEDRPANSLDDRKRAYTEISQNFDRVNFTDCTPQKRAKTFTEAEPRAAESSRVGEAPNDLKLSTLKSPRNNGEHTIPASPRLMKETGAAPSVNWNAGTKAKIRTSLGGGSRNACNQETGGRDKTQSQSKVQSREIKKARIRLDALEEELSTTEHVNPKFRSIQERIYEAEVDYDYCLCYPTNKDYYSLFEQGQEDTEEIEDEDESGGKSKGKLRGSKPPLWRLVERCMKAGKLEDLKSGTVDEGSCAEGGAPLMLDTDSDPSTPPQKATQQVLTGSETKAHAGTLKIYGSGKKTATVDSSTPDSRASDLCDAIEDANIPRLEYRIFALKVSPKPQDRLEGHEPEPHDNPKADSVQTPLQAQESYYDQETDHEINFKQDEDSERDGRVHINLQTSEQESGEVSETNNKAANTHRGDQTLADESSDPDAGEGGDAMMGYARSDAVARDLKGSEHISYNSTTTTQNSRLLILALLNPEDLKLQLRYFHATKRPSEVGRNTLARCLVCAQENHMADDCVKLTCTVCRRYGDHFSQDCPQKKKCSKCRALGHVDKACPYKLKHLAPEEIICDLCQRNGHYESDCELLWRTSGRPWESELMNKTVRLSCYECGKKGHLGNDCPTRRPGKLSGTSTWSLHSNGQFTIKSKGEVTIKGRAQRQNPIIISDSDDDQDNFYRPRIPEPARKGQIRITTGTKQTFSNRQPDLYTAGDHPHRNAGSADSRAGGYWDTPREDDYRNEEGQNRYRSSDRRSLSPCRSELFAGQGNQGFNGLPRRPDDHPALRGRSNQARGRDRRGGGHRHIHHHPMPSAAQKAWSKHRT